jgi:hypothetical protein
VLTQDEFSRWLMGYGEAFSRLDADAAGQLFSESATYYESPFAEPIQGRSAIIEYWRKVASVMRDVEIAYEVVAVAEDVGVARLQDALTRTASGRRLRYDGIFVARFDADLHCREFREWWVEIPER